MKNMLYSRDYAWGQVKPTHRMTAALFHLPLSLPPCCPALPCVPSPLHPRPRGCRLRPPPPAATHASAGCWQESKGELLVYDELLEDWAPAMVAKPAGQ